MVPYIEQDSILLLGIMFYIRNMLVLGLTTKKPYPHVLQMNQQKWDAVVKGCA